MVALLWSSTAAGGEEATTHRAGDMVWYHWGCHDAESVIKIVESDNANELGTIFIKQAKCFYMKSKIPARLVEWIAGPLTNSDGHIGSVWRIFDAAGHTEFAIFADRGGRHPARQEGAA